jgi:hypothetical protein
MQIKFCKQIADNQSKIKVLNQKETGLLEPSHDYEGEKMKKQNKVL